MANAKKPARRSVPTPKRRKRQASSLAATERRLLFAREYLIDFNATQAAIRAGYSPKSATAQASLLLTKSDVQAAIADGQAKRVAKIEIRADTVLRELARLALADIAQAFDEEGALRPIRDMPEDVRRAISSYEVDADGKVKVKFWSKPQTLESLGKHLRLFGDTPPQPTQNAAGDTVIRRVSPDGTVVETRLPAIATPVPAP